MRKITALFAATVAVVFLFSVSVSRAEVILLEDGKIVEGKIISEDSGSITVETAKNIAITIKKEDIKKILTEKEAKAEFSKRRAAVRNGDADGLLELARWAQSCGLDDESKKTAEEILKLEPENAGAKQILDKVAGNSSPQAGKPAPAPSPGLIPAGEIKKTEPKTQPQATPGAPNPPPAAANASETPNAEDVPNDNREEVFVNQGPMKPANTEKAVKKALKWLAENQAEDGSWNSGPVHQDVSSAVVQASFCGLAFMANGYTPKSGKFAPNVRKAVEFVTEAMLKPDGGYADNKNQFWNFENWRYSIGGLLLCEAYAVDNKIPRLKEVMQEVIKRLEDNQERSGGWGHFPHKPCEKNYIELEIMSNWALATIAMADKLGIKVNDSKKKKAIAYIEECFKGGGIAYSTRPNQSGTAQAGRTAGALFAFALAGHKSANCDKMVTFFEGQMNSLLYGHASPAMHYLGGALGSINTSKSLWEKYVPAHFPSILAKQNEDGSFKSMVNPKEKKTVGDADGSYGPPYSTGIFTLILSLDQGKLKHIGGKYYKK
jgi:hypothetical protein